LAGCLFVNTATKLAPTDAEVRRISQNYLSEVDHLFTALLRQCGLMARRASHTGDALMALTPGAIAFRKAGASEARVRAMLAVANQLVD